MKLGSYSGSMRRLQDELRLSHGTSQGSSALAGVVSDLRRLLGDGAVITDPAVKRSYEVWGSETPSSSTSQLTPAICALRSGRRHGCRPNRVATRVATQAVSAGT
jgi:hypothetical protein